jgi:AraC family transcriptional regulator
VNRGGLSALRLRLIDERLSDIAASPSLAELAALCDMSVRQLTRAFRESRGQSIGTYIAKARVEAAKHLLAGDRSIKSIAYHLGFTSPSTFTQAFRRATGETPGRFRVRYVKERPALA